MKTLIQSLAFACLSLGFASTSFSADAPAAQTLTAKEREAAKWDHITVKEGKVWIMKEGTKVQLTGPVALLNGTQVNADGSYVEPGSTEAKVLREGEAINWEGKVQDHDKLMRDMNQQQAKEAAQRAAKAS